MLHYVENTPDAKSRSPRKSKPLVLAQRPTPYHRVVKTAHSSWPAKWYLKNRLTVHNSTIPCVYTADFLRLLQKELTLIIDLMQHSGCWILSIAIIKEHQKPAKQQNIFVTMLVKIITTLWVLKVHFLFNSAQFWPIWIILHCCILRWTAEKNWNKIYHLTSNLLPHYLAKT